MKWLNKNTHVLALALGLLCFLAGFISMNYGGWELFILTLLILIFSYLSSWYMNELIKEGNTKCRKNEIK